VQFYPTMTSLLATPQQRGHLHGQIVRQRRDVVTVWHDEHVAAPSHLADVIVSTARRQCRPHVPYWGRRHHCTIATTLTSAHNCSHCRLMTPYCYNITQKMCIKTTINAQFLKLITQQPYFRFVESAIKP